MWINADPTWGRVTSSRWKMTRWQSFSLLCLPFQLHFAQLEQQCHSRLLPHESFSTTDTVHGTNATPLWRFATNKQRNSRVCLLEFLVYFGDRQKPVPTVDDHDDLLLWYWSMSTILRSNYIHCTTIMECFDHHHRALLSTSTCVTIQRTHCYKRCYAKMQQAGKVTREWMSTLIRK